jgi:diguanylate cyclase (GGDEF)-like protein
MLLRLVTQLRALTTQAHTDPLTGAFNRRHLESCLAVAIARRNRTGEPASLLLFDVDHFKQINDGSGHAAGDEVLKTLVARRARTLDVCFRIGGDEFVLLLPATRYGGAFAVAEDIRALVANAAVLGGRGVSISVGVSDLLSEHTASTWLEDADAALFVAKHGGRNRIAGRTLPTERDRRTASQPGWRPSKAQQVVH